MCTIPLYFPEQLKFLLFYLFYLFVFQCTVAKEIQENTRDLDAWFKGSSVFGKVNSWSFGKLKVGSDAFPYHNWATPKSNNKGKLSPTVSSYVSMVFSLFSKRWLFKLQNQNKSSLTCRASFLCYSVVFKERNLSAHSLRLGAILKTLTHTVQCPQLAVILLQVHRLEAPVRGVCDLPNELTRQICSLMNNT